MWVNRMLLLLSGLLLLFSLPVGRYLFGSPIVNPLTFLFSVWFGDFALFSLNNYLQLFTVGVSEAASLRFVLSFAMFSLGAIIVGCIARPGKSRGTISHLDALQKCIYPILFIYLCGIGLKYTELFRTFGLSGTLAQSRMAIYHSEFKYSTLAFLLTLSGYVLVLNLGILAASRALRRWWWLFGLTLALAVLNDIPSGTRGQSVSFVLLMASSWGVTSVLCGRRITLVHVLRAVVAGVAIGMGMVVIHLASPWSAGEDLSESVYLESPEAAVMMNYIDVVGTIPAFTFHLERPWPKPRLPGLLVFDGAYAIARQVFGPYAAAFRVPDVDANIYAEISPFLGDTFTAVCYLTYVDQEWGLPGDVAFSLVLGLVSAALLIRARVRKRIVDVELAALFLGLLLFSWRTLYTRDAFFYFTILASWIEYKLVLTMERRTLLARGATGG